MDNNILIYAFRYALGRQSYCVADVIDEISSKIHNISSYDKCLIIKEIDEAKKRGIPLLSEWERFQEFIRNNL